MVDKDLALVDLLAADSFMEELKARGVRLVEIEPADDPWINNSLVIAPACADAGGRNESHVDALAGTA